MMGLSTDQRKEIFSLLENQIRRKLLVYAPETTHMPFHVRLLGKDRMALFSFIQSINTTLGTSVFEQVAAIIASVRFKRAVYQFRDFNDTISTEAQRVVQDVLDDLRTARKFSNKMEETRAILSVAKLGKIKKVKRPRIDLYLESRDGVEYFIDLKTAKPNLNDFVAYKRNLLEWIGIFGAKNTNENVRTLLAIPYNPYEPEPYQRWTLQGLFDLQNEFLVAEELWDFLGGEGTYLDVLEVFEEVGLKLRPEIDDKFSKFTPDIKNDQLE